VDADGTLIRTDLLFESFLLLIRQNPRAVLPALLRLLKGRAELKRFVASRVSLNAAALPYNLEFVAWLKKQRSAGRRLVLATASDELLAGRIAEHLGIFDAVIASDGHRNLKSEEKATEILRFFPEGFDYAGNSSADLPVWRKARKAVAVDPPSRVLRRIEPTSKVEAVFFTPGGSGLRIWARALRVHQWLKNLLVFVPVVASHSWSDPKVLASAALVFGALSLSASSLYIFNDLLDLEADRKHPRKGRRPFACGALNVPAGLVVMILSLAGGVALASVAGPAVLGAAVAYVLLSGFYSLWIKNYAPADIFFLTGLYVLRITAGGLATHIHVTDWLLAFAMFLFLGLACCKRAAELQTMKETGAGEPDRRDYSTRDLGLVTACGVAASFTNTLVLVLYLNSDQVRAMYRSPIVLWLFAPLVLFWQIRLWMLTVRGEMHDDPVLFAATDGITWLIGVASLALMLAAMKVAV
jgi:4-hydroxybenzoate polyprenyltransferase/phosphoserine phosphatase